MESSCHSLLKAVLLPIFRTGTRKPKIVKHLGKADRFTTKGTFFITSGMRAGEVEKNLHAVYELSVKIFKKLGAGLKATLGET